MQGVGDPITDPSELRGKEVGQSLCRCEDRGYTRTAILTGQICFETTGENTGGGGSHESTGTTGGRNADGKGRLDLNAECLCIATAKTFDQEGGNTK